MASCRWLMNEFTWNFREILALSYVFTHHLPKRTKSTTSEDLSSVRSHSKPVLPEQRL